MPVLKVYQHGASAGIPPTRVSRMPSKRGVVSGWSQSATRRNTRFLYSVREQDLTGEGFAVTLTVKRCPPSHVEWEGLRKRYVDRLRRMGITRMHWVTEWQRRGVPHLHFAVWFPETDDRRPSVDRYLDLDRHWLEAGSSEYGAETHGQHVTPIETALGWFQYVAKHASRGAGHYQRSDDAIPKKWTKTGRMWGHIGDWPTDEAMKLAVDKQGFFAYRRIVRNMRVADARASESPKRVLQARRMLRASHRPSGEVRGVSEWVSMDTSMLILAHLGSRGFAIEHV